MAKGNHIFDRMACTGIHVLNHRLPAFQVCGYTGVVAAIVLAMTLIGKTGLSYWAMGFIALSAMATFLAAVFATKIFTGEEHIVYYHQEIAVMLVATAVARLLHRPALPYLDVMILAIGAFLACGRIGCLMVGCCHGRPCAWGICYHHEHAREGFAAYLVHVRLFPIQLVESLWVLAVVIIGAMFVLDGRPAGSALAFYTIAYGAARFGFEFVRGDTDRPYTAGFSQGQWISLWLMLALIAAEFKGSMEFHGWHVVVVACVISVMAMAALHRKLDRTRRFHLFHPYHVDEIAEALRAAADQPGGSMGVACTSIGLRISTAEITITESAVHQYAFSFRDAGMQHKTAAMLADLIMRLRHQNNSSELLPGEQGVFHLLVRGNGDGCVKDGCVKKGSHKLATKQMHGGAFELLAK